MFLLAKKIEAETKDSRKCKEKLFVNNKVDMMGTEVDLLVFPEYFSEKVKRMGYKETQEHLGVGKNKKR